MIFRNFLLFALLFSSIQVSGQKVLGCPEVFKNPADPYDENRENVFISGKNLKKKESKVPWWVVVDRDDAQAFTNPDSESLKAKLKFGASYYVLSEKEDWVELVDAIVDGLKIVRLKENIGWVQKRDLLLWNKSLISPRTKVTLRVMAVNKYDDFKDIPCDKKEAVKVYASPRSEKLLEGLNTYRFYFVYKKEGVRYLLGETQGLSYVDNTLLLGWVDKGRIISWNNRVALEPNFTQDAYNERKANPNFTVYGFANAFDAEAFGKGEIGPENSIWSRDPVRPNTEVAKTDIKRFPGGFMRFPLLSVGSQNKNGKVLPYFESAVCDNVSLKVKCVDGKAISIKNVPMGNQVKLTKELEDLLRASKHYNVFYVIEGTGALSEFKESIAGSIETVKEIISGYDGKLDQDKANIKFGALIYKDIKDVALANNPQSTIQSVRLTSDYTDVGDFIRKATFSNPNTTGNYPVQNYGLQEALKLANFQKDETNILIVVGQHGDFSKTDRMMNAQYQGKAFSVSSETISENIAKGDVNVIAIQCIGGRSETDRGFLSNMRTILLESSKKHYNSLLKAREKNKKLNDALTAIEYNPVAPNMDDPAESNQNEFKLENSTLHGSIFRAPVTEGIITNKSFNDFLASKSSTIVQTVIDNSNKIRKWSYAGLEAEGFNPKLTEVLSSLYEESNLDNLEYERFELYKEVYFSKKPVGAKYPTFSYVMFWPERDLRNYYAFLEKFLIDLNSARSSGERRRKLADAYCRMLEAFGYGEDGKDCNEYTPKEILGYILGVNVEELDFSTKYWPDMPISCLLNLRCVDDEQIELLMRGFVDSKKFLGKLLKHFDGEEFVFSRGGEYFFWIKLTDMFL